MVEVAVRFQKETGVKRRERDGIIIDCILVNDSHHYIVQDVLDNTLHTVSPYDLLKVIDLNESVLQIQEAPEEKEERPIIENVVGYVIEGHFEGLNAIGVELKCRGYAVAVIDGGNGGLRIDTIGDDQCIEYERLLHLVDEGNYDIDSIEPITI